MSFRVLTEFFGLPHVSLFYARPKLGTQGDIAEERGELGSVLPLGCPQVTWGSWACTHESTTRRFPTPVVPNPLYVGNSLSLHSLSQDEILIEKM